MLYAILAYHVEADVMSWTPEEDAAVMTNLRRVHARLDQQKLLGPSARLGATGNARTVGCHLHFEIHVRGRPIDPVPALARWGRVG